MPKTVRIAKTAIDDAIDTFSKLPPKASADYSLREAIGQIVPAINDSIKKGYSLDEIGQLLNQKDIAISSTTLKQYLRDFAKSKPKKSRSKASAEIPDSVTDTAIPNNTTKITTVKKEKNASGDKTESTDEPYKSPPKAGSEQFK